MNRLVICAAIMLLTIGCASSDWKYSIIRRSDPTLIVKVDSVVVEASGMRTNIIVAGYAPRYTQPEQATGSPEPETLYEDAYLSKVSDSTLHFFVTTPRSTKIEVPIRALKRIDLLKPQARAMTGFDLLLNKQSEPMTVGEFFIGMGISFVLLMMMYSFASPDRGKEFVSILLSPYVIAAAALLLGYLIYTLMRTRDEESEPERPSKNVRRSWFFRK